MSPAHSLIEDTVIDILTHTGPCTMDELVGSLPSQDWSQVFSAVDQMSRDGRLVLRRIPSCGYRLSLSPSRPITSPVSKKNPVPFCVGCGYLCDKIDPEDVQSPWVEAQRYLHKYRLTWIELDRNDEFCPACARVFASAHCRSNATKA
jgi:hypothetical protein